MPKSKYKKRADGRYVKQIKIGFQDNGKPKYKNIYAKTIPELENKISEFKSQLNKGILVDDKNITLGQWAHQWLSTYKNDASYNTYAAYEGCIRRYLLKMQIANLKISKITPIQLQQAVNQLTNKGLTRSTELFVLCLHQIFAAATENDLIFKDPSKSIKAPKFHKKENRALTEEEKNAIKNADYTPKERAFVMIGWQAGLRRGEILALRKRNIDFKKGIIHVKDNLIFKENVSEINHYTKTDAGVRDVPMPKSLSDFLKTYVTSCDDYLFTTQNGQIATKSMLRRMFSSIQKKTSYYMNDGMKPTFTAHTLRHTYATTLYYAGIDVKTAQYLLGHKSITVTLDIYTHLERSDADITEKLTSAFQ